MVCRLRVLAFVAAVLSIEAPAFAQAGAPAPAPSSRAGGWEIEAFGGVSLGRWSSGGKTVMPDPGPPITTSSPVYPSWRVPSWFFGDGAAFLNNVAAEFGLAGRITPLDVALGGRGVSDAGNVLFGLRVRRPVTSSYSAEIGFEFSATSTSLSQSFLDDVEASRSTFQSTFTELLATGPFVTPAVTTSVTSASGSGRELLLTGALVGEYRPVGGWVPFVSVGGGLILPAGEGPTMVLEGNYRFNIAGAVPINETDHVVVRYSQKTAVVALVGGGVRRDLNDRFGIRIDGRLLIGRNSARPEITADPRVTAGTPAGYIESFTYPNLQFSNNASTGRLSTLSGSVTDFDAFSGGAQVRLRVMAGIVYRF